MSKEYSSLDEESHDDSDGGKRKSYKVNIELPIFKRTLHVGEFLDWLSSVEKFFNYMDILANKKVKLVVLKLQDGASTW